MLCVHPARNFVGSAVLVYPGYYYVTSFPGFPGFPGFEKKFPDDPGQDEDEREKGPLCT